MQATDEQTTALDLYASGMSLTIEAGAGTGKTSTLRMLAESDRNKRGQYCAFNKRIVVESATKFPSNVACQPDGTMVRVPVLRRDAGRSCGWTEVAIEKLRDGDKVVSWNERHGAVIRKRGKPVKVTSRPYAGEIVVADLGKSMSRYTPEHPCIAVLGDAFEGRYLVYLMQRGAYFKVGMCRWRLDTGRNGLAKRAQQEDADAFWILSAHVTRDEATLAEALAQYEGQVPGWCFRDERKRDLTLPWSKIAPNGERATALLASFGRDVHLPLWARGHSMKFGQQNMIVAACNLMTGMRMLAVEDAETKGEFTKGFTPRRVWRQATVRREWHEGTVTSLEVEDDHTYFADGILTHNCNTAHSLAFRDVGRQFAKRLNGGRMQGWQLARELGIDPFVIRYGSQTKVLQPQFLAGHAMKAVTRFCQSADLEPGPQHVPYIDGIDVPDEQGKRTWENNGQVRAIIADLLPKIWADLTRVDGKLPFKHDTYVKIFELGDPQLHVDTVFFDECQDASPVLISIMHKQRDTQMVWVGDSNQSIYAFTGAINALASTNTEAVAYLSQSFRFGPSIADVANVILRKLDSPLTLKGLPSIDSRVEAVAEPDAILCRTNAGALERVFELQDEGKQAVLVGGGKEMAMFARAARDLQQKGSTSYADLACFTSWQQVLSYVENDPQGDELALSVRLVENYGTDTILSALDRMPSDEATADCVVSTAHRSKGMEWPSVQLHSDFKAPEPGQDEELRLLYVAATRAQQRLDVTICPAMAAVMAPDGPAVTEAIPLPPAPEPEPRRASGLTPPERLRQIAEGVS